MSLNQQHGHDMVLFHGHGMVLWQTTTIRIYLLFLSSVYEDYNLKSGRRQIFKSASLGWGLSLVDDFPSSWHDVTETLKQFKVGPILILCDSISFSVRPHSCEHWLECCIGSPNYHTETCNGETILTLASKMPTCISFEIILSLSKWNQFGMELCGGVIA